MPSTAITRGESPLQITNAIVLMTALVPTTGHQELIRFASKLAQSVDIIISARGFEPTGVVERLTSLRWWCNTQNIFNVHFHQHNDNDAPQNPSNEWQWHYWEKVVHDRAPINDGTILVASETYGIEMAKRLGIPFYTYDVGREINRAKGTTCRQDIRKNWDRINPLFRKKFQKQFVLFGQESVGKTTLARLAAASDKNKVFVPEWARGFLETVGKELTETKMAMIARGQAAVQKSVTTSDAYHTVFFDTDLLSTIGYYKINGMEIPDFLWQEFYATDFTYILLPDDIPFEPDPLRYGGDKRESKYEFWLDLLQVHKRKYREIRRGNNMNNKLFNVEIIVDDVFKEQLDPIAKFKRE